MMNTHKYLIKSILLITVFLLDSSKMFSQVMSLENVLNEIEKNQPELKKYDAKINAYDTYATGAKALDAPQVGAGFFMTPYNPQMWKADPAMNTNGMGSFMLSAQQMIMNPKKLNANSNYMKSMSGIEKEMKGSMKNELFSMAKMSYYEWVVLKRRKTILMESESILKYLIESTELRYKYGMDKLNAYYKAKGMLGDVQTMMVMTNQEINQKMIELNTLMNHDKSLSFDVDTLIKFNEYENVLVDSAAIMSARSDFKILKQSENLLRTKQTFENSKRLPDFGLKYDHMLAFGKQPQQFSLMAMVTIPIAPWSSKMYKSTVKGLNYEIEASKFEQQGFVNNVSGTIENIKVKIKNKKQQIELSEKVVIPSMKKNYETTLLAYEQNTEELFMVLDAWQNLKLMQLNYIDQLMELVELQIQYENQLEIK
ncbi:MAG: TolC family protein [Bacteroidetes bacterium]|nr:TolC family protein [Bacteroidota bacterium]